MRQRQVEKRCRRDRYSDIDDTAKALHKSVKGMTLLHTRQGKMLAYWTVRTLWERATTTAGIEDAHIHDIRAKAATDARAWTARSCWITPVNPPILAT